MAFKEKLLTSLPARNIAGFDLKVYHVTPSRDGVEPEVARAAYDIVPKLLPEPDGTPQAGFLVVHRGGDASAYVDAYAWAWDNVLNIRFAAAAQPALGCPDDDMTHFVVIDRSWLGCVWEIVPIVHERNSWVRHMLEPDEPDLAGYLADYLPDGTTGGR